MEYLPNNDMLGKMLKMSPIGIFKKPIQRGGIEDNVELAEALGRPCKNGVGIGGERF